MRYFSQTAQQQRVTYLLLVALLFSAMFVWWFFPVLVYGVCALAVLVALPFLCCYHHCCRKRRDGQSGEYRTPTAAGDAEDGPPPRGTTPPPEQRRAANGESSRLHLHNGNNGVPNAAFDEDTVGVDVEERVEAPRIRAALKAERIPLYAYSTLPSSVSTFPPDMLCTFSTVLYSSWTTIS